MREIESPGSRRLVLMAAMIGTLGLAGPAFARTVQIHGKVSRGQLQTACSAVGGVCGNCTGKSGKYACNNLDKGTSVDCTADGKCTGTVPDAKRPHAGEHELTEVLGRGTAGLPVLQVNTPTPTPPTATKK